jgi:peptide/nickel transport system ATP-binding protein
MSVSAQPILDVRGLSIRFGGSTVVRDASFSINPGEILGIVGESGSGKSVTCRAAMGLLPPSAASSGSVRWQGRDLLGLSEAEWRAVRGPEIGMIFQNPSSHLDPLKRIGTQIAAPMRRHLKLGRREAWARAVELLQAVDIRDPERAAKAYPHQFSGGMKQRAMIAAAIGCGPKLLIADEPTTALDVTVQARILRLLKQLNRERGLAIILVSHDLSVIADICTRVVVMRRGEVVEERPVADVISRPREDYTRLLIASQPDRRQTGEVRSAQPSGRPLLSIERLTVEFSRQGGPLGGKAAFRALDAVDLAVSRGETVGIVGESGSGKTTLARALVRLNPITDGMIRFDEEQVPALTGGDLALFRRRMQMVFQNPYDSLNPRLTATEAVAEPIWRHGMAERGPAAAEAHRLLELVELPSALHERKPRQLSGGQCQRVGLARALALKPELLIADEITSALDVTTQAQILDLLARLQRERQLTLLYISHDLSVVSSFCHRVYVFKDGRIVEDGTAREVLSRPRHPYTQELVASLTDLRSHNPSPNPAEFTSHVP